MCLGNLGIRLEGQCGRRSEMEAPGPVKETIAVWV